MNPTKSMCPAPGGSKSKSGVNGPISTVTPSLAHPFTRSPHNQTAAEQPNRRRHLPRGLSLLEVILALAILAGSVTVIGELLRTGMLNAVDARDYTRAELHAESIMSQIVAGAIATGSISNAPVEDDPNFLYSVVTEQIDQAGLLGVHVTVTRVQTSQRNTAHFTLTRWMVDPQMEMELATQAQATAQANAEAQSQAQENAASSSSTGSSSSGSGGTQSGGGK